MVVRTNLIIVIFCVFDRCLVEELRALWWMRSTMDVKRSFFLRPKCSGSPKYFPTPPSFVIPNNGLASSFTGSGVFAEKVIGDLSLFIICPEGSSYSVRISFSFRQQLGEALQKNTVSSAKSRWYTCGLPLATRMPGKDLFYCATLHRPDITSPQRMKM